MEHRLTAVGSHSVTCYPTQVRSEARQHLAIRLESMTFCVMTTGVASVRELYDIRCCNCRTWHR